MKKIISALKDFLYNITDYGLIVSVILVMAVILGWRFNILFNMGIEKEVIDDLPPIAISDEPENDDEDEDSDSETSDPTISDPTNSEDPGQTSNVIATITIPDGSFPSKIADILLNSNLISDKNQFLNRAVELGLDTRLRSGDFDIEVGTPLDDIIKKIANAQ